MLKRLMALSLSALSLVSFIESSSAKEKQEKVRASGVIPDDPQAVIKVRTIMSLDGLSRGQMKKYDIVGAPQTTTTKGGGRKGDRAAPTVSILSPANGSAVSGSVSIQVSASDNVGVTSVSCSVDGVQIGSLSAAPFVFVWNAANAQDGYHQISVRASDLAGNTATQTIQVAVNVAPVDVTPPNVQFRSPLNGDTVDPSSSTAIDIAASDAGGIASVSLSVNSSVISTKTSAPFLFSWDSSNAPSGTHVLTAKALDKSGNSTTVSIVVAIDTTVVIVNPPVSGSTYQLVLPPVGDQGGEGSCVAFAVGYGARSIEQYYRSGASGYSPSSNIFSPEYLYNLAKFTDQCSSGTAMQTALDVMLNRGIVPWQSMPYSATNGCNLFPTAAQDLEAANFKIGGYAKMLASDVGAIKAMLLAKHPVIMSVPLDPNFLNAGPGFIWSKETSTGGLGIGHAMLIVGFDDDKKAYRILNSWGTDWGDAGLGWITYDLFNSRTGTYVYAIDK